MRTQTKIAKKKKKKKKLLAGESLTQCITFVLMYFTKRGRKREWSLMSAVVLVFFGYNTMDRVKSEDYDCWLSRLLSLYIMNGEIPFHGFFLLLGSKRNQSNSEKNEYHLSLAFFFFFWVSIRYFQKRIVNDFLIFLIQKMKTHIDLLSLFFFFNFFCTFPLSPIVVPNSWLKE